MNAPLSAPGAGRDTDAATAAGAAATAVLATATATTTTTTTNTAAATTAVIATATDAGASEFKVFDCALEGTRLIEASAGTGKTWNTCGLYLRLLLERALDVQQVLVVTFTNAATAELRERIRARIVETLAYLGQTSEAAQPAQPQIGEVPHADDPHIRTVLTSAPPPGADAFVADLVASVARHTNLTREAMRARLELALQTFDEAAIFTIHGFCQRALADTPFAARLPLTLELVEDDGELVGEAVRDFWRRHVAGNALSTELAAYLVQKKDTPEKYARLLRRHLAKPLAATRWPEDIDSAAVPPSAALPAAQNAGHAHAHATAHAAATAHATATGHATAVAAELAAAHAAARATWRAQRDEIVALLAGSSALSRVSYKEDALRQGARDWDAFFRCGDALAPFDPASKLKLYSAATLADCTKKNCTAPTHRFFEQAEAFIALRRQMDRALQLGRLRLLRRLLDDTGEALRAKKRERRVVSFDDMLFNVHERLAGGACPWLAEALRLRFPAALVDEFQDTDPLQFAIFNTIYGDSAAPLFLVGDPKQAIYSFRHADLHTYLAARAQAQATYTLAQNQRSTPGLIAALNALFAANERAFMLDGLDYAPVGVGAKPRPKFIDATGGANAALQAWMLPHAGEPLTREAAKNAAASATAAEIARLLTGAAAGQVTLAGAPLRSGDIAVLVRSRAQGTLMRQALAALNIGSVELAQSGIFQTSDAEDVARVLAAILEPGRERLLRAALATELLGFDAAGIEAISHDEAHFTARLLRFTEYRAIWQRRGVGFMFRRLLSIERVAERMLARPDGERRLTNLLHLAECLHQAAETHPAPDALMNWLHARRREDAVGDVAQLRLESDRNLVQIVTIHKSKGLEYPLVFCPFLWDGCASFGGNGVEGCEYHADDGTATIDLRGDAVADDEAKSIKQAIKLEDAAETLRLIYVALTRAVHRCHIVAGCYVKNRSLTESTRSLLNWLVAGHGRAPADWFEAKLAPEDIAAAWSQLAARCAPHLALAPLSFAPGVPITPTRPTPESVNALAPPAHIPDGWRIGSYSGLSYGAVHENAARDHDARSQPAAMATMATPARPAAVPGLAHDDILRFPRGAAAGDCIHAVMERIDFTAPAGWSAAIDAALLAFPQRTATNGTGAALAATGAAPRAGTPGTSSPPLAAMLARLLTDLTQTELLPGLRLQTVDSARRLVELEFALPAAHLSAGALNHTLKALGYDMPRLTFNTLDGYLKGFIDLVVEHAGRYYIVDWKSNHLGYAAQDYAAAGIDAAMREHGYHLQYLLYSVALDRYLQCRLPGYDYATHFGGALYMFVRGVRPGWQQPDSSPCGVMFHRPAAEAIAQLNALFSEATANAALAADTAATTDAAA